MVRSRCPCCEDGHLFKGVFEFRASCEVCGLHYEQWSGDWITPPYIASSVGMLVGIGSSVFILATGIGLDATIPPEYTVSFLACAAALAALRPAKAGWLAFLYRIGGVEVSAETRAKLRWTDEHDEGSERLSEEADRRARSVRPRTPLAPVHIVRRFVSLRETLFPRAYGIRRPPSAPAAPTVAAPEDPSATHDSRR
jgi:uncharacterized protein (DUF983 family)